MLQIGLLALIVFAAVGFISSLVLHVLAIAGLQPSGDAWLFGLLFGLMSGIFPVFVPAMMMVSKLMYGASKKDAQKLIYSGCPSWMKTADRLFRYYAMLSFVIFLIIPFVSLGWFVSLGPMRAFSILATSYGMLFYFVSLAAAITVYQKGFENLHFRCPNGHIVGYSDSFCSTCGALIDAPRI
jgi:hypothetical protein